MSRIRRVKKVVFQSLLSAGFVLGLTSQGLSHHSHAMFDHAVEVTITGTVKDFSFRNPHVFLYIDVAEEGGEVVTWSIEMSNIGNTIRRGIGANTFKPGDVVTVTMNPLKSGQPGGNYTLIVAGDGQTYQ
jgi:hypothetical protein